MMITSETKSSRRPVTAGMMAMIRAAYKASARDGSPVICWVNDNHGHDARETLGRVVLDRMDDIR